MEDDSQVRSATERALRGAGYDVLAVERPRDALQLPGEESSRVKLLITDVVTPELDGRALAEELRHRQPALRVLYLSGESQEPLPAGGEDEPGGELLPKPYTGSALLQRVRSILDAKS